MNFNSLAALKPYLSFFHPVTMWALLGLFGWQAVTGVQIVQKIVSHMTTNSAG